MSFEYTHKIKYRTNKDPDTKFHIMTLKNYRQYTYSEIVDEVIKKIAPKRLNYLDVKEVKKTR